MNYKEVFEQLGEKLQDVNIEASSLTGQCSLLNEQNKSVNIKLKDMAHEKEVLTKSVELLTLVQQATKEKMKEGFEAIVTYALKYIYNDEYSFQLEFGRRGNLQELDFNIKTPDFTNPADPKDTSGGGVLDILSLALRTALLELAKPKIEGFIILDEPFKHLSKDYLVAGGEFLKVISARLGRQIIMVTHQQDLLSNTEKLIKIG